MFDSSWYRHDMGWGSVYSYIHKKHMLSSADLLRIHRAEDICLADFYPQTCQLYIYDNEKATMLSIKRYFINKFVTNV
ncbi:hypothetical protein UFOVP1_13 [uncultured Caudovirales phage]|uniref:Uncharacterized protein n=1 Tax=uncultured Caudovirales phage TaxID=2100421 RepID=A0A6J5KJ62_9CAUD|nr:hypothetical protein UFOVP1_13 [uncultured Caudovirales phage]